MLTVTSPMPGTLVAPPPKVERDIPADSPIVWPVPKPYAFWRHPFRFVWSRLRMMFGAPLSVRWGLDRGLPAHRYYIKLFFREFCGDIHGKGLEFEDRDYLNFFGGENVTRFDVINLFKSPRATIVADITQPNDIPDDFYDVIICTHVLHMIPDFPAAIRGMHRILKPGGVLLCASPHVSWCSESEGELWRFTRLGLEHAMQEVFGKGNVIAKAYGNSLVAAGEMRGLIADEYTYKELHTHDSSSCVEVCSRAVKGI